MTNPASQAAREAALKPCPFCGANAREATVFADTLTIFTVECSNCEAERASDKSHAEARELWNTRFEQQIRDEVGGGDSGYACDNSPDGKHLYATATEKCRFCSATPPAAEPVGDGVREALEKAISECDACWGDHQDGCRKCEYLRQALASAPARGEDAETLARHFHDIYERLAPSFGYETREETRQFDPASPNGKLMIAVCAALRPTAPGEVEKLRELSEKATAGSWFVEDMSVCAPDDQTESPWEIAIASLDCGWDRDHATDNLAFIVAAVNHVRTLLSPGHPIERAKEGGGK